MPENSDDKITRLLAAFSEAERRELLRRLRTEFPIHKLESDFSTTAEVILEAISRGSDLSQRGVRGLIAEAAFKTHVVEPLIRSGWSENQGAIIGDAPFDFQLTDSTGKTGRIQVKMQRLKNKQPMRSGEVARKVLHPDSDWWVVETQRTRGGKDSQGNPTRPYRFGEFDILSVCLHPSTGDWSAYLHTVANWLIPDPTNPKLVFKYQPVPRAPNGDWTDSLDAAFKWLQDDRQKEISRG